MYYQSQLTQSDPRDALRYTKFPIVLYTKLVAECDQQTVVVWSTVDNIRPRPPSPSVVNKRPTMSLVLPLGDGERAVVQSSDKSLSKSQKEVPLFFEIPEFSYDTVPDGFSDFDAIPACDRYTDEHTDSGHIGNTAL